MELFKHTLFINLDSRVDRLDHALAEFEKMDMQVERVSAIKNKHGAIGCTMSHIKCLQLAKERDYEYVFVCEDDITFLDPNKLKESATLFLQNMKSRWDVLIIGGNNVPPYQKLSDYCARIFNCQTTTGYVVQKHFYDTLIENFKESATNLMRNPENKREYALDIYWKRLQQQHVWLMLTPPTVSQYESYSDIENKNVNYDHLMLDMNKEWYMKQLKQQALKNMNIQSTNDPK
jgi:glycosyl transferase, family 25|uniref:Glycosyl transferase family 25 domain-containing protein n=1 Tax=viral metagenome TaxID=1070528 RepID=A0A6C0IQA1_9ZZZZ